LELNVPTSAHGSLPPTEPDARASDTRERILDAAARIFAENGYARTTTKALATEAGITEMTLFRHFGSKENLFAELVERYGGPALATEIESQLTGDYRVDLLRIGQLFLNITLERREMMRLFMCEAAHFPELADSLSQNPRLMRAMLSRYLQQQIDRGHIRPLHVEAAAQAFWGMFFTYGVILDAFNDDFGQDMPAEEIVAHFVDIFVYGTLRKE